MVHFVRALLAVSIGRLDPLSNCLAASAAIQNRWDRGARRAGSSMGCGDAAGSSAERALSARLSLSYGKRLFAPASHFYFEGSSSMNAQTITQDPFLQFKQVQKQGWAHFSPLEALTIPQAPRLVRHAKVRSGDRVLDVGCGTGVVAITAAKHGAHATGIDLTPELLERARQNASISELSVDWREGDAENLPFDDGSFDVVVSQFGHIFAPRPEVAIAEMLRVLKPGGTIAFSSWPPELHVGRSFALISKYLPPPPGVPSPALWGDPRVIQERLGSKVKDIVFDRACMMLPILSLQLHRATAERTIGPLIKLVETLSASDPAKLAQLRAEAQALAAEYVERNILRQDYLLTRATKV